MLSSTLISLGLTDWSNNWEQKGWNVDVQNKDLFRDIRDLAQSQGRNVHMKYVPGHSDEHGNETANDLAQQGARSHRGR